MRRTLALFAALALLPLSASADTTYTYTGNDFTFPGAGAPYTTSDSVSGYFTVASPLAPNLSFSSISYTSYSFSDGVQTMTNLNSISPDFDISTDGSGSIVQWYVALEDIPTNIDLISTKYEGPLNAVDWGVLYTGNPVLNSDFNVDDPGTWTSKTVSSNPPGTPEPSSLILLGTGLLGVVSPVRRRLFST